MFSISIDETIPNLIQNKIALALFEIVTPQITSSNLRLRVVQMG